MSKKQQLVFLGFFLMVALLILVMLFSNRDQKQPKISSNDLKKSDSLDTNSLVNADSNRIFMSFHEDQKLPFILNLGNNFRLQGDTIPNELDSFMNQFLAENQSNEGFVYEINERDDYHLNLSYQIKNFHYGQEFYRTLHLKIKNSASKPIELPLFFEGGHAVFDQIKNTSLKNVEHILVYGNGLAMCGGIGIVSIMFIQKEGIIEFKHGDIFYGDAEYTDDMSQAELEAIDTEYDTIEKIYLPVYQDGKLVFRRISFTIPGEDEPISFYHRTIPPNLNPAETYISEKTAIRKRSNNLGYYQEDTLRVTDYFYRWDGTKSIPVGQIIRKKCK